jgi:hypothetical protein
LNTSNSLACIQYTVTSNSLFGQTRCRNIRGTQRSRRPWVFVEFTALFIWIQMEISYQQRPYLMLTRDDSKSLKQQPSAIIDPKSLKQQQRSAIGDPNSFKQQQEQDGSHPPLKKSCFSSFQILSIKYSFFCFPIQLYRSPHTF